MIAKAPVTQAYQQVQPYLFSVAYRMTGSASDAEDLVQDAWIRYLDAGSPPVDSIRAYLTTIVSRLSLDFLKSARVKREQYTGPWMPEPVPTAAALGDPAATAERRESVSFAYLTLLERLNPEQRIVYVLREALDLPYNEIAVHVGKSAAACRQIYHRAQGKLGGELQPSIASSEEHRRLVERFLEVVQAADPARIASVLSEDVVLVGDGGPNRTAARRPIVGIEHVARGLAGYASKAGWPLARLTMSIVDLNGAPAVVLSDEGVVDQVYAFDIRDGRIATVRAVLNLDKLRYLERALAAA